MCVALLRGSLRLTGQIILVGAAPEVDSPLLSYRQEADLNIHLHELGSPLLSLHRTHKSSC